MISTTLNPMVPFILLYDIGNVCRKGPEVSKNYIKLKKIFSKCHEFYIVSHVFRPHKNDGEVKKSNLIH